MPKVLLTTLNSPAQSWPLCSMKRSKRLFNHWNISVKLLHYGKALIPNIKSAVTLIHLINIHCFPCDLLLGQLPFRCLLLRCLCAGEGQYRFISVLLLCHSKTLWEWEKHLHIWVIYKSYKSSSSIQRIMLYVGSVCKNPRLSHLCINLCQLS